MKSVYKEYMLFLYVIICLFKELDMTKRSELGLLNISNENVSSLIPFKRLCTFRAINETLNLAGFGFRPRQH